MNRKIRGTLKSEVNVNRDQLDDLLKVALGIPCDSMNTKYFLAKDNDGKLVSIDEIELNEPSRRTITTDLRKMKIFEAYLTISDALRASQVVMNSAEDEDDLTDLTNQIAEMACCDTEAAAMIVQKVFETL